MRTAILLTLLLIVSCAPCQDVECPDCVSKTCECPPAETLDCPVCEEFDLNTCPTIVVQKNITVTEYVCENGLTVSDPSTCFPDLSTELVPLKRNQTHELIEDVSIEPACVYGYNGGVITYELGSVATDISVELSDGGEFYAVHRKNSLGEGKVHFVLGDVLTQADFQVPEEKVHLLRMVYYFRSYNLTAYTDEYLVDTRLGAEYSIKKC